jgi:hypothetical protein
MTRRNAGGWMVCEVVLMASHWKEDHMKKAWVWVLIAAVGSVADVGKLGR